MALSNSACQPSDFVSTNLTLFVRFLEWVKRIGGVHVVYPSSGGTIYGESEIQPTPETVMPDPRSFCGLMKWTAEKYLQMFASQKSLTYTIARISNPYGPGQVLKYGQGLVPEVIVRIRTGKPVNIIGNGDAVRDYIHISDVCTCLALCGFDERFRNHILNVGTGVGFSVLDVVREIEALMHKSAILEYVPRRLGEIQSSVLDIRLAKQLVGWQPELNFQDGLKTLF
jgi:UDP-glucose 4-epimerase